MNTLRFVDGFNNYGVRQDGTIVNIRRQAPIGGQKPGYYVTLNLKGDDGKSWVTSRHRFVALAWLGIPPTPRHVVNHKNSIKGDDRPENLEWVTHKENLEHGFVIGNDKKTQVIEIRRFDTMQVVTYKSIAEAGSALGVSRDTIQFRAGSNGTRLFDGLQYRRQSDEPWPIEPRDDFGRNATVLVRDVFKREISVHDSQRTAAAYMGCCESVISNAIENGNQPLIRGRYQVQRENRLSEWRNVQDVLRESRVNKAIVVTKIDTGESVIYPNGVACATAMGIKPTTLSERLRNGTRKQYGGYAFSFY